MLFTSFASLTPSELGLFFPSDGLCYFMLSAQPLLHAGHCSLFPKLCFSHLTSLCSRPTARLRCRVPSKFSLLPFRIPSRCQAGHLPMSTKGILSTGPEGHQRWVVPPQRPPAPHQILGTPGFGLPCYSFWGRLVPNGAWVSVHDSLAVCWHIFSCP